MSLRERAGRFWARHRTLLWMLHSAWALIAGTAIVLLAREHYHFVLWVVFFLALAWASTLYFGRVVAEKDGLPPGLFHEVTSYLTRHVYQETLFFLLPFYAYSTVIKSPNVLFLVFLGGLAVLSCIDLLFDRWLRTRPVFGLTFFAIVTFATINLLLPILVGLPPHLAAPAAALLSIVATTPLALRAGAEGLSGRIRLVAAAVVMLAVVLGFPGLIPPVPLRLERATFTSGIDRTTLAPADSLTEPVLSSEIGSSLFVIVEVFAPSALPATVNLEWKRDGELLRVSREVGITAHAAGFRVWDGWHPSSGPVPPGRYRVVLLTSGRRVFGVAELTVKDREQTVLHPARSGRTDSEPLQ